MSRTLSDYLEQIKVLLPVGALWESLKNDKTLNAYLESECQEKLTIDYRISNIINETDPRSVYELLPEWELFAGLPGKCYVTGENLEQRREALHYRLTAIGGQSINYFIQLAKSLGFDVTVSEFDTFNVNDTVSDKINTDDWEFAWQINTASETVDYFSVSSDTSTALASWGNQKLECVISKLKPAHTVVIFSYGA